MADSHTSPPPRLPAPRRDVFSVSRRFDLATLLVAMLGYAILFGGLMALTEPLPGNSTYYIAAMGVFFAVVAVAQAIAIPWNCPRAASVIAGTIFWLLIAIIEIADDRFPTSSVWLSIVIVAAMTLGPLFGYLAGALVGGAFLISHYLRETHLFRRRASQEVAEADSTWDPPAKAASPGEDYKSPLMVGVTNEPPGTTSP